MATASYPLLPLPPAVCNYDQYAYTGGHSHALALAPNRNDLTRAVITTCCPTFNITALNDNCLFQCDLGTGATLPAFEACVDAEVDAFINATNSTGPDAINYADVFPSGATSVRAVGMWALFAVMASVLWVQGV